LFYCLFFFNQKLGVVQSFKPVQVVVPIRNGMVGKEDPKGTRGENLPQKVSVCPATTEPSLISEGSLHSTYVKYFNSLVLFIIVIHLQSTGYKLMMHVGEFAFEQVVQLSYNTTEDNI
jgi:hypothetical protein